ncbi:hypothetical protein GW17_00061107 [Ensete ventricosum]|nr:hypothetical protein GW17_00061107 [Ensete ventricosum]
MPISPAVVTRPNTTTTVSATTGHTITTTAAAAHPSTSSATPPPSPIPTTPIATSIPIPTAPAPTPAAGTPPSAAAAEEDGGPIGRGDVHGLAPTVVGLIHGELDGVTLRQRPESLGPDGALVDEEILAAAVGCDEAKALGAAEPDHRPRLPPYMRHLDLDAPPIQPPSPFSRLPLRWLFTQRTAVIGPYPRRKESR